MFQKESVYQMNLKVKKNNIIFLIIKIKYYKTMYKLFKKVRKIQNVKI